MYGRYGIDELYKFSLVVILVLIVADIVLRYTLPQSVVAACISLVLSIAFIGLYVWMIYRTMSRNIYKRRLENERFLKLRRAFVSFYVQYLAKDQKS